MNFASSLICSSEANVWWGPAQIGCNLDCNVQHQTLEGVNIGSIPNVLCVCCKDVAFCPHNYNILHLETQQKSYCTVVHTFYPPLPDELIQSKPQCALYRNQQHSCVGKCQRADNFNALWTGKFPLELPTFQKYMWLKIL